MTQSSDALIISGVHLDLTEALKNAVREKVDKLFAHESHIIRIRVELEYNANNSKQNEFTAKGHIEIKGPPMIISVSTDDLYKSIDEMTQGLDRMLRRRSRLRTVKRKNTHEIDLTTQIPKATSSA